MRTGLQSKFVAAIGILLVAAGAFLVVAPSAGAEPVITTYGGNPSCAVDGFDWVKADPVDTSGDDTEVTSGDLVVTYSSRSELVDDVQTLFFDWSANQAISIVLVKQGNGGAQFTYDPPVTSGTVYVIPAGNSSANGISHLEWCVTTEATTTTAEETTTLVDETTTTTEVDETTTTTEVDEVTTTTGADAITTTTVEVEEDGEPTTTVAIETTTTARVGGDGETTTTAPPGGVVVQSALPRTGSSADRLVGLGVALMVLGATIVGGSSRRALR